MSSSRLVFQDQPDLYTLIAIPDVQFNMAVQTRMHDLLIRFAHVRGEDQPQRDRECRAPCCWLDPLISAS